MEKHEFSPLGKKWEQLEAETKKYIIKILQHKCGRVTFPRENEPEYDSPISITMNTDDGCKEIYVTDVYLRVCDGADVPNIKAAGNDSNGDHHKNITVLPHHLSSILYFIDFTLSQK